MRIPQRQAPHEGAHAIAPSLLMGPILVYAGPCILYTSMHAWMYIYLYAYTKRLSIFTLSLNPYIYTHNPAHAFPAYAPPADIIVPSSHHAIAERSAEPTSASRYVYINRHEFIKSAFWQNVISFNLVISAALS